MISHLIFDLDNTLYSARHGLERNVSQRLEAYVAKLLNISIEESQETHRELVRRGYGTTIEWLITEKGFTDIAAYYAAIYPPDEAEFLLSDPKLDAFLTGLPQQKAILTNSPLEHAVRILERLGVERHFPQIFDIRANNFKGKPHKEAYFLALNAMNAKPETTLFIDDYPEFVTGFLAIKGKALLLDEFDLYAGTGCERIKSLKEIERFL